MSLEDRTVEASDQGPSVLPGDAGDIPLGSPAAADRRPRGRPRRDVLSSTPKPRKKVRSRGRAAADDDDSTDGMEEAESDGGPESGERMDSLGQAEDDGDSEGNLLADSLGEDGPLSPVFQHCVSEDSAGSSTLAAAETKMSEQLCAFCYCGEKSLLGQGELKMFGPTPGYVPLHIRNRRGSSENDTDVDRSPERDLAEHELGDPVNGPLSPADGMADVFGEEPAGKLWGELGQVGLPDDINVQSLFDPTGQCCAHRHCAAWSEGVRRGEGQSLLYVDKAIDSGSTKHCAYCKRLGASIKCSVEKCICLYHYPCAAATAGTFQDNRSRTLLCPKHIQLALHRYEAEANCALCDSPGDLLDQLFCTSCGQHYHGLCLDVTVSPLKRAGWQCPECKVCQTCKNPGEDSKMLVCDMCDKGYHTFCLQPVMDTIPTNGWRCKNCRVCVQCGTRSSAQWHHSSPLCEGCSRPQEPSAPTPPCPLCGKTLNPELPKDLLSCHTCKRWFHADCERQAGKDMETLLRDDYVCTACKQAERDPAQNQSDLAQEMTTSTPEPAFKAGSAEDAAQGDSGINTASGSAEWTDTLSALDPAQEIQVTVTVTERPTSPQLMPGPVEEVGQSAQGTPAGIVADGAGATKESPDVPLDEIAFKPMAGSPGEAFSLTKESAEEPTACLKEPMKPPPSLEKGEEWSRERLECREEEMEQQVGLFSPPVETNTTPPVELDTTPPVELDTTPPVEMDTTPRSERSFSDLGSSAGEDREQKRTPDSQSVCSVGPAQSPVSAGSSPMDAALTPPTPATTIIPVMPKIGMGKPAISKRKFSAGRPRVKQGACSDRSAVSSPSWSPDHSDGGETPKNRQPLTPPLWNIKVGRGSGFPGRRRPRGASLSGRGGRGRSKLKGEICPAVTLGLASAEMFPLKEEEENAMHNTVVLFSSSDSFTLRQDMCVVCGSFGQGAEGRLLACSQCGQCYHPFCVNIKITKVVLSRGWRCLECTVCEACGQATDPGRLLLCDDCDISYHTYCLDPPLLTVPKGGWKCKWCVSCTNCGATSPGPRCEWQNNYTQCAPCASLATCPVCLRNYQEDELIVLCRQCDRWIHGSCQNLNTDQEVEDAADGAFDCTMCRALPNPSQVMAAVTAAETDGNNPPITAQSVTRAKEPEPQRTYTQDGVCLTELGLSQLQSLALPASRRKRPKPKLKLKIINQNSVAVLQAPADPQAELSRDEDPEDGRVTEGDVLDCEGKSESSPEREPVVEDCRVAEGTDGAKKRKRKPYRPGIGGFMVRQRSRTGQGKAKQSLSRKDSSGSVSENLPGKEEGGWSEAMPDTPVDEAPPGLESLEKVKKRYRKKKTKLEEAFPSYLQEAFFGKELLDKSKQARQAPETGLSDDDRAQAHSKPPSAAASFLDPSSDPLLSAATTPISNKAGALANSEDPLVDLSEVLNTDEDILGMLSDHLVKPAEDSGLGLCPFQVESSPSPFAGLDIGPIPDDPVIAPQPHPSRAQRTLPVEPLDGILSPELDKMVTDGAILSKLYKIPELEGKDVEDLFTAVLSPSTAQPPQLTHPLPPTTVPSTQAAPMPLPNPGGGVFPRMPMMNGLTGTNPLFSSGPMVPGGVGSCVPNNFSTIQRMTFPDNMREKKFNHMRSEMGRPWPAPVPGPTPLPTPLPEGETDTMSNAQRSTLKWEKEETLGEMATVAPVLYTNVNFPNLREEFPDWTTRVKQIAKLWRKASSQERAPYVQKARDNRAALRINKVQISNESMKRQQQQQQPDLFDPSIPPDSEHLFKDTLKHKESEHEQEWKFRQQMRQKSKQQAKIEATQKLEQVKNEQQQQQQQLQYSNQSGGEPAASGNRSPATSLPSNGNVSPLQPITPKETFPRSQLPGTPPSAPSDDVFVRPQPPPPASSRTPTQDSFFQGQQPQVPPPQMYPPSSSTSQPTSPWDPYAKMVGTPRPSPTGSGTTQRSSVGPQSPAQEPFGPPTSMNSDTYGKPHDPSQPTMPTDPFVKPVCPPRASSVLEPTGRQATRGGTGDPFTRPGLRAEVYQRMAHSRMILSDPYSKPLLTPIPGSNESGSVPVFKAPMPLAQSQDPFASTPSTPRHAAADSYEEPGFSQNEERDPYAHPPLTPRPSMNNSFSTPPRMGQHPQGTNFSVTLPVNQHSHRDPFTQSPSIPRTDYSQQSPDPYAQPPGTPRPSVDSCAQPPGPPGLPVDPYAQPPGTPGPRFDPYAQPPSAPRLSADPQQLPIRRPSPSQQVDPYAHPPGTPRPANTQQPDSSRLVLNDPYTQPPGTPHPGASQRDPCARLAAPGAQTPNKSGMVDDNFAQLQPNQDTQTLAHDPYEQAPMTPRPQSGERLAHDIKDQPGIGHEGTVQAIGQLPNHPQSTGNAPDALSSGVQPSLIDTEEKLKQRQRLRELILRQQQQKSAIRQEKGLQGPPMLQAPGVPGPPRPWTPEDARSQNEHFSRPPPPYPGMLRGTTMTPGGQRFPGPFLSDQQGHFPPNGQFARPQFPRNIANMGMRPHSASTRFEISPCGQAGQEHFLRPSHPMQGSMMDVPQQLRRSLSGDMARSMGGNPAGLPQHFPSRGLQMPQHNIMGQPFIELRHRAESRLRQPFGPPATAAADHPHRTPGFGSVTGQEFASNPATRMGTGVMMAGQSQDMGDHLQMSSSLESLHQHPTMGAGPQHFPLMRSLSHPATMESFGMAPPTLLPLATLSTEQPEEITLVAAEGMEEKLDTDDSTVKDLEDVEVKDLVDDDLENLNLDPDDGKDLDLEANDLHLDDLLTSGKFDIIAYTDPELDLGDKKDMFNEELDLSDPIDEHGEASEMQKAMSEKRNSSSASFGSTPPAAPGATEQSCVKREIGATDDPANPLHSELTVQAEVKEGKSLNLEISTSPGQNTDSFKKNRECIEALSLSCTETAQPSSIAAPSGLSVLEKKEETRMLPATIANPLDSVSQANPASDLHQNRSLPGQDHPVEPVLRIDPSFAHGAVLGNSEFPHGQPPCQSFGITAQEAHPTLLMGGQHVPCNLVLQGQQTAFPQDQVPHTTAQHNRPLLLEEQPLLLQDLLDQERQEQQQQRQMQAMIRQGSGESFPSIDFDAITDPIMKAKMVALKGINKVMVQNNMGMPPMVMNRIQQDPGEQCPDGGGVMQRAVGQDINVAQHFARPNPPNFEPGFLNDTQKKQYEDWLKETQQLLQMQQKFLEEKIGAHRKSKKALSAKQRTAKKAGREFPEEDQEQLRHVTEQQSVVQKELEQIRKQQKEHTELIEEYRVKQQQQQCSVQLPMMPGAPPQGVMMPVPQPMGQRMMSHMMQMQQQQHLGRPAPPRMTGVSDWQPGAQAPLGGSRMPPHLPPQMPLVNPTARPTLPGQLPMAGTKPSQAGVAPVGNGAGDAGGTPQVKFDDNNPFSEGFQERERKERLREQQERQRVQLMQEVERQRALQQRLEMEQQQGMPGAETTQMALYNSEMPHNYMQPQRTQQQQMGAGFPQQTGFVGLASGAPFRPGGEHRQIPRTGPFSVEMGPNSRSKHPMLLGSGTTQGKPRPVGFGGPGLMSQGGGEAPPFSLEPATPLPPNYPGSGQSLIQLYSNIIPDEKGKKKRNRKKKKDEDGEPVKTPSTPHSDLTAPLTPCVSNTASTPTRRNAPPADPEDGAAPSEHLSDKPCKALSEIKLESVEPSDCSEARESKLEEPAGTVKVEEGKEGAVALSDSQSPTHSIQGELGNELLKHLLKNKGTPPAPPHQIPGDSPRSEDEGSNHSKIPQKNTATDCVTPMGAGMQSRNPDMATLVLLEQDKKKRRNKRLPKSVEKSVPRYKKRKKEEEPQMAYSSTDTLMTQLKKQLSLLPLLEPLIGVSFAHFPPYGSGQLNGESRLTGAFGCASLDGVPDYYSQLIYKQSNLSNPPTPPASLPPTPPPLARQKMVNGFATTEELARKAAFMGGHDVAKSLVPKQLQMPFRPEDLLTRAMVQGPKSVDVPASLPTPPHNNQEELRGQEHCEERDTPESFVPSSSPESVVGVEISRYPDLSLVKDERPSPAPSPVIPLLPSSSGKGTESTQREVKMEQQGVFPRSLYGQPLNCSKGGLVSIAISLNPSAAENIPGVVAAVADLLCVKVPGSYEVSSTADRGSLMLLGNLKAPPPGFAPHHPVVFPGPGTGPQGILSFLRPPGMVQSQNAVTTKGTGPAAVGGDSELKAQWCCHCNVVVLGKGVRKSIRDLPCITQGTQDSQCKMEGSLVFCSHNCVLLYSAAMQSKATEPAVTISPDSMVKESAFKIQHQYSNNISTLDVHCLAQLQPKQSPPSTSPVYSLAAASEATLKAEPKPDPLKVSVKMKPRPQGVHNGTDDWAALGQSPGKRWKGLGWRKWSVQVMVPKGDFGKLDEDEIDELLKKLGASLRPEPLPRDLRKCCFCQEEGDGLTNGPARLLNLDLDLWVHLNCALWSTEVYETQAGALINVELALRRGLSVKCAFCQRAGATSGCHRLRCANVYHFTCALRAQCTFFKDKTMLCHQHRPRGAAQGQELRYFAVFRRVYVQRDEARLVASMVRRGEREHTFRVGSLVLHAVGQLLPQQMAAFHAPSAIFPVGYEASRIYWSTRHANRRCRYLCSVDESDGQPEFSIRVMEQGYQDLVLTDTTPKGVWDKVLGPVAERRAECGMLKLFPVYLKGEDLFGLTISAVTRIIESLPGVEACETYTFRYGRNPLMELPLAINPTGSARSQPKTTSLFKRFVLRPHTLTSISSSKSFQSTISGEISTPYSKQFVHSKSSQYRKMKAEWKSSVYLARSGIQGLGLYAAKDIEKYTMIIEYIGTIIRNEVANRKEKLYQSQNRGVYMFRLDSEHVIDATITGGPARYINHSCAPNCVAEVVTFEKGHKIIISSNRRIQKGEEMCYDYKFDLEDDQHKIPCNCGAVNCRKWMN